LELYGQIKIRVRDLAAEAKRFYDEFIFGLIAEGFNTTGSSGSYFEDKDVTCYDGKAFFATNHSEGLSGTQSNKGTSALGVSSLKTAITSMKRIKNDQGKIMGIRPNLLVVPSDLEFTAREILQSQYYPEEGSTTAKLATNVLKGVLDLLVTPYLTDTNNWFLFDTTRQIKPIILLIRKKPTFEALDSGTESWFMRKKLFYGVDMRANAGWGLWQTGYGAQVS